MESSPTNDGGGTTNAPDAFIRALIDDLQLRKGRLEEYLEALDRQGRTADEADDDGPRSG